MSEREEPIAVKAKPFGRAMRGLDGFEHRRCTDDIACKRRPEPTSPKAFTYHRHLIVGRVGPQAPRFRLVCRRTACAVKPGGPRACIDASMASKSRLRKNSVAKKV